MYIHDFWGEGGETNPLKREKIHLTNIKSLYILHYYSEHSFRTLLHPASESEHIFDTELLVKVKKKNVPVL